MKKNAIEKEIDVVSMDDYSVFGRILYQLKFSEAIENDLLSDYQVVVVGVDDEMVRNQIINRDILFVKSSELEIDAETLASHIALLKATREHDLKRVITFHGLVKGAKKFAKDYLKVNRWMVDEEKFKKDICSAHVSGNMSSAERNQKINNLKNLGELQRGILTNARCLAEGVDVPTLDGIAFIDPRQSQVDIIQAVGRAIRKSKNKTFGTIVIPVYLTEISGNIDDQVLASKFSSVWKIILALKSQDDSLMEEIDSLRISYGKKVIGGGGGLRKIILDLPEKIDSSFVEKFNTILIRNTSDDWLERFGELKEFFKKNGNSNPPTNHPSLGRWVNSQRVAFKKNKLNIDRVNLMNQINFCWDVLEAEWNEKYYEFKQYLLNNNYSYPTRSTNKYLGHWVKSQRRRFNNGELPEDYIRRLNEINFIWDYFEENWNKRFQELKTYFQNNGHSSPPTDHPLFSWCVTLRSKYNKKRPALSQTKKDLLNELNFVWNPDEYKWNLKFQELRKFFQDNGHFDVPVDSSIWKWIVSQRSNYKRGKLSLERIKLLNDMNFVWDAFEDDWQRKFKKLKEYEAEFGHGSPTKKESAMLSQWISSQRLNYFKKTLSQEKIKLLENIKGWKWKGKLEWIDYLNQLEKYLSEHENQYPRINASYLGKWLGRQRLKYKKGLLTKEKINALENLNGWQWLGRKEEKVANFVNESN